MRLHYILLFVLGFSLTLSAQVAVIAHKEVPADEISHTELYDFYTGDIQKWNNGKPVIVLDLKPKSELKDQFYEFMGTTTSRIKSIWLKKMLAGEKDPPQAMETELEMLKKVASTPGSIGFVAEEKVTDKVKVLYIIKDEEG